MLLLTDFNISSQPMPEHVVDMIQLYHHYPLYRVNECSLLNVYPSANSGYRPFWWEKARGRSGTSQHCFGERNDGTFNKKNKGATDITCDDFANNKAELFEALKDYTNYTRLCMYNTFIHADYKNEDGGLQVFRIASNGKWEYIETI